METIFLSYLNELNNYYNLEQIDSICDFKINKSICLNNNNGLIFTNEIIELMSNTFNDFADVHNEYKNEKAYIIKIIQKILPILNNDIFEYSFNIQDVCTISKTNIQKKIHSICVCIRNNELRKKLRETNPNVTCICGLFEYRDKPNRTHTSYGEYKGNFTFENPDILYNYILNGNFERKYLFLEYKTQITQAFVDLDFKYEKQEILRNYLPEEKLSELINYILNVICGVMNDINYLFVDKNIGYGIHLYFPNKLVTKNELISIIRQIQNKLINENYLNLPNQIVRKFYKLILDDCACHSGLVLPFQYKNRSFYKINKEKSTYLPIPDDKIKQLKLCSLRHNVQLTI